MRTERLRDRFTPWAGLALGTLGFFLAHQIGSDATFENCRVGSPWLVIIGTILGLALIAAGALSSLSTFRNDREERTRRTIAAISLMSTALFALAIVLPSVAALLIPRCWE
jgi:uncharacterized membrane protein YidH (DUF202 family)